MKENIRIYTLAVICFIISITEFVIVGILDIIANSVHVSVAAAGQLLTVYSASAAIGVPIAIMACAKWDRSKVLQFALGTVAVGNILMFLAPNFLLLLIARIVLSVGSGIFTITAMTVSTKLVRADRQGSAIATINTGFSAALILGLPLGRVLTAALGWKAIFLGSAMFSLMMIFVVAMMIPKTAGEEAVPLTKQILLLKNPRIIMTMVVTFFWIGGYGVLYTYITPFLQAVTSMNSEVISVTLFIFGFATLVGTKLGGYLGDHVGIKKSLIGSMVGHALVLFLLTVVAGSNVMAILLLVIWAVTAWATSPVQQVNVLTTAPESSGMMLSLNNSFLQLGFAIGAGAGGIVMENSLRAVSLTGALFVVVGIVFAFISFRIKGLEENTLVAEI
jgi:DHA1 family putative efflux transporter-like MFS transporter